MKGGIFMNASDSGASRRQFLQMTAALGAGALLPGHDAFSHPRNRGRAHFVLVHGAWYGAWCWYKIFARLQHLGHNVTVVDLPAHGVDLTPVPQATLDSYAQRVISVLPVTDDPVILVGHSMGGIVISTVAEAQPRAIDKLVYLSAFLLTDAQTLFAVASVDPDAIAPKIIIPDPANGVLNLQRDRVAEAFLGHTSDSNIELATALYRPDPIAPFVTPVRVTPENFGSVRRFYISCLDDKAVSVASQRQMIAASPVEAVFKINTDHSAFLSTPDLLTERLIEVAHR
jgi:pimeloyl-ACP methyl ester carboxylesterase